MLPLVNKLLMAFGEVLLLLLVTEVLRREADTLGGGATENKEQN